MASLWVLTIAHCLIDAYSLFLTPLWPDIQHKLGLGPAGVQLLYVLWALSTSGSQIGFAYIPERYLGRRMIWIGLLATVVGCSLVGLPTSPWGMGGLLLISGLGVGAFHPEAASLVGKSTKLSRSRAMSIFVVGGMVGTALGPMVAGAMTASSGMGSLQSLLLPGIVLTVLCGAGLLFTRSKEVSTSRPPSVRAALKGRWKTAGMLLLVGMLRAVPTSGTLVGLAFLLKSLGESNARIGIAQSTFQVASALGALGCAMFIHRIDERIALWGLPLLSIPTLLLAGVLPYGALLGAVFWTGLCLGGAGPVLIAIGQQLLPKGQRFASAITMGLSWSLASGMIAIMMAYCEGIGRPEMVFPCFAGCVLLSSWLCQFLKADSDAFPHEEDPIRKGEFAAVASNDQRELLASTANRRSA